jgi:hypothetical protein
MAGKPGKSRIIENPERYQIIDGEALHQRRGTGILGIILQRKKAQVHILEKGL